MRVLSGIQPTGTIHLGNYFGAIRQWVDLQHKHECVFMVVDLHAMTTQHNPGKLREDTLEMFVNLLAAGIDPKRCILFIQSHVKEHTELAWILSAITPLGELYRMTQFKDKAQREGKESANAGLLTYPILQAADIFLYQTDLVPIGKDQEQHLEFSRVIARKFNRMFGETFKEPKALIPKAGAKIMSIAEPTKKMSKSLGPAHVVGLFAEPETLRKQLKAAVTDSGNEIAYNEKKKPGISNLLTILSLTSGKEIPALEKEWEGKGYAEFKTYIAEEIVQFCEPFRRRRKELINQKERVEQLMSEGAEKARAIARITMERVRKNVGI